MIIRHKDIIIPKEKNSNPFENCKFEREKYAKILTNIVETYADGFVLAINNPWGEGKTTFVKMWNQSLMNKGYKTLYFNAWENDFQKDALITLISELSELEGKSQKSFDLLVKNALPLTGKILPSILKHLISKFTGNEAIEDISEAIGEFTENQLNELTEDYKIKKSSIEKFKTSLEEFAKSSGNGKPLVFIIDELDRCRPNFAVEVLERIKHLFSVPGIIFILSIDKVQLSHAVKGVYGSQSIDANEYLRRFIDLEYSIPKPLPIGLVTHFITYYNFDVFFNSEKRKKIEVFKYDKLSFITFVEILIENKNLSIRQCEKLFIHTRLVLNTFKSNNYIFPSLTLLLIYIKFFYPNLILELRQKKKNVQDLLDEIEKLFPNNITDEKILDSIVFALVQFAIFYNNYYYNGMNYKKLKLFSTDMSNNESSTILKSKFDKSIDNELLINAYLDIRNHNFYPNYSIIELLNKVELMDSFEVE